VCRGLLRWRCVRFLSHSLSSNPSQAVVFYSRPHSYRTHTHTYNQTLDTALTPTTTLTLTPTHIHTYAHARHIHTHAHPIRIRIILASKSILLPLHWYIPDVEAMRPPNHIYILYAYSVTVSFWCSGSASSIRMVRSFVRFTLWCFLIFIYLVSLGFLRALSSDHKDSA
jgi:hypothetical protein